MKRLPKKSLLIVIPLLTVAIVVSGFVLAGKVTETRILIPTTWHFMGGSPSQVLDPNAWEKGTMTDGNCSPDPANPLPCLYTVHDANIANHDQLVDYFIEKYKVDVIANVVNDADYRKPIL